MSKEKIIEILTAEKDYNLRTYQTYSVKAFENRNNEALKDTYIANANQAFGRYIAYLDALRMIEEME